MKLTFKKGLLIILSLLCVVCFSFSAVACDNNPSDTSTGISSDSTTSESSPDDSTGDGSTHNYSEDWSYNNTAHWHACTDEGCEEVSDYAEHTPADEGTLNNGYYWYTCEVCGQSYRSEQCTYIVYVKNIGDAGVSGVKVNLYDQTNTLVSTVTSGSNGTVRFRNMAAGNYTAIIDTDNLPAGYSMDESDATINFTSEYRAASVYLTPHLITEDEATMPSTQVYKQGSVMYDFDFTCYYLKNGEVTESSVSLSDYLEEYKVVIIQFFYTRCSACMDEFPSINQAYNGLYADDGTAAYSDYVGFIEFDYTGVGDTLSIMQQFMQGNYGYENIAYVYDSASFYSNFGVGAYPTTAVIDRYGVVALLDSGSQPTRSYWTSLFEKYISDDYTPDYVTVSDSSDTETDTEKPTYDMPESGEIANAIVKENNYTKIDGTQSGDTGTFEFSAYSVNGELDEYSWPWLINSDEDSLIEGYSDYIYTSNANKLGTYSILVIDVKLEKDQVFMFDYFLSTEADGDYLYIQVDTVLQAQLSGVSSTWQTFCYVAQADGYYQITLLYQKNTSVDEDGDCVYARNMRLGVLEGNEITGDAESDILSSDTVLVTSDLLYNAATAYTIPATETAKTQDDYGEGLGYANYASVYYATDGYYHVNYNNSTVKTDGADPDDDDPILLADLYYSTPWNTSLSIWNIAYAYLYTSGEEYGPGIASDTYELDANQSDTYTADMNSYFYFTATEGTFTVTDQYNGDTTVEEGYYALMYLEKGKSVTITSLSDDGVLEVSTSGKGIVYDQLAAYSELGLEAFSYAQAIEDYAWLQTNGPMGYVPVTQEVAEILKAVTYSYGTTDENGGGQRDNEYQWLEVCRYYIHYGATETDHECLSTENLSLSYGTRSPLYVGSVGADTDELTFHANVEVALNPSGFYYSFTAETEGVYLIYTDVELHDEDGYNADGSYGTDPSIWITDKYAFGIAENDDYDLTVYDVDGNVLVYIDDEDEQDAYYNDNSYIYVYLEAGDTYMIGCALSYITDTGEYDVHVKYVSPTYTYFTPAVTSDIYTYRYEYDEATDTYSYVYYLPSVFASYYVDDDGYWYAINEDGTESPIYINMTGITYLNSSYSSYTIEQAIENNAWSGSYNIMMREYLYEATINTDTATDGTSLNGYVRATYELTTLLNTYINGSSSTSEDSTFASNAWLLTAYFERSITTYTSSGTRVIDEIE